MNPPENVVVREQVGAVSAGESIGDVSMLTGGQHTATAVAVADTTIVAFDGARRDAPSPRHRPGPLS